MSKRDSRGGEPEERYVAVFPDEDSARRAAQAAERRGASGVAVNDQSDKVRAVLGEQREEMTKSWVGPSIGAYTPEMVRQVPRWTALGAVIGLIVALPLGMIDMGAVSAAGRFAIAGICGAVAGGTIGFLFGGMAASRRRASTPLAGEVGTVVGVSGAAGDGPVEALSDERPLRIDQVVGMQATETVSSGDRSLEPDSPWEIPDSDDPEN